MNVILNNKRKALNMELELAEGIDLEFTFNEGDSSPEEKRTHADPGCAAELSFDWVIKIEDLDYFDDLEVLRDSLTAIIEGKCIQEMMEKEFTEQGEPECEPDLDDFDYDGH